MPHLPGTMEETKVTDNEVLSDSPQSSGDSTKESKPSSQKRASQTLGETEDDNSRTVHGFQWVLVCASLYVGALIYGLDTTITADIQASIIERFNNIERLTWVGTGFPLGSVCAVLPM